MFLGLDLSTQQLKGVVIDVKLKLRSETVVSFDTDLPHYETTKGAYVKGKQVLSPVAMWVEALDLLLQRMVKDNVPLAQIQGISGSGQQHGSIYWSNQAEKLLAELSSEQSLKAQLCPDAFSYDLSPNWQDASTQTECDEIEQCVGGADRLAELTGSKAHHRFTGPQILRLRKHNQAVYDQSSRISLVSSFLCSLFLGRVAPIDPADICGGNFWDIKNERYVEDVMALVSGGNGRGLEQKLGKVCMDGSARLGPVARYFREKYGFAPDCQVMPFTGDNPATILALPLLNKDAMISLGTSTTMLLSTPEYVPSSAYHLFAHPTTPGFHMAMLCYKNGSLAREYVRNDVNLEKGNVDREDWTHFNDLSSGTKPPSANDEFRRLAFYFPLPEIIPQTEAGYWRFVVDRQGQPKIHDKNEANPQSKIWTLPRDDARAILESQFLDIRMRSQPFFNPEVANYNDLSKQASRIYCVGGASQNPAIIHVAEQVLGGEDGIYRQLMGASNACALGGANKAAWAMLKKPTETFEEFVSHHWIETESIAKIGTGYQEGVWEEYGKMLEPLKIAEDMIVSGAV
ncbi:Probable D-xylulose kinase A [Taphrina deformans PYCC 5710]|uniref:Xylulose kinase n=1 Tax=Taphrina deformans (strain PYCC 5710 / ATCC 11124 / CBS 356.35 / IMI 108563 / JCM 9778 / NBRC 8474) TaxID=1097556 RepID=R4X6T1_TAPDE|nr:Probable D-xylulose kinase A [Taphrina deformans PYCC 5710]|eukprot:CCG80912.1 Probable D-xylulose kinase A [Taphrina deformans PYCC 5710]